MRLSELDAVGAFKEVLADKVAGVTIYANNKPTAGLPNEYINIRFNGMASSVTSKLGLLKGNLLLEINVKLLSSGARHTVKEKVIFEKFDELFSENKAITHKGYTFELDLRSILYEGGGAYEGYSSKFINIIYNKK